MGANRDDTDTVSPALAPVETAEIIPLLRAPEVLREVPRLPSDWVVTVVVLLACIIVAAFLLFGRSAS